MSGSFSVNMWFEEAVVSTCGQLESCPHLWVLSQKQTPWWIKPGACLIWLINKKGNIITVHVLHTNSVKSIFLAWALSRRTDIFHLFSLTYPELEILKSDSRLFLYLPSCVGALQTGRCAHLGAGTADLTHVTVVDLRGFRRLFGSKLFTLEGGLFGESVSCPGCCCRHSCHSLFLLLLLLLLLVVVRSCRVHSCFITRVRGSWKTANMTNNSYYKTYVDTFSLQTEAHIRSEQQVFIHPFNSACWKHVRWNTRRSYKTSQLSQTVRNTECIRPPTWELTRVGDSIRAVRWALGVRWDHRGCSSNRLDCGRHWEDGERGRSWTGSSWFYHGHLAGLLGLCVWCHPLSVSRFGSYK